MRGARRVGFRNQVIFADHLGEWWGALLGNGMTAGGLTAIALTLFMELTGPRSRRIGTALTVEALPEVTAFLREFASRRRWSENTVQRLCSAGEETLLSFVQPAGAASVTIILHETVPASIPAPALSW